MGWAKDMPRDASLGLVVDVDRPAGLPDEPTVLRDAIHEFFLQRAHSLRRRLLELFRVGRKSLRRSLRKEIHIANTKSNVSPSIKLFTKAKPGP